MVTFRRLTPEILLNSKSKHFFFFFRPKKKGTEQLLQSSRVIDGSDRKQAEAMARFATCSLLGVAYAANTGGTGESHRHCATFVLPIG